MRIFSNSPLNDIAGTDSAVISLEYQEWNNNIPLLQIKGKLTHAVLISFLMQLCLGVVAEYCRKL